MDSAAPVGSTNNVSVVQGSEVNPATSPVAVTLPAASSTASPANTPKEVSPRDTYSVVQNPPDRSLADLISKGTPVKDSKTNLYEHPISIVDSVGTTNQFTVTGDPNSEQLKAIESGLKAYEPFLPIFSQGTLAGQDAESYVQRADGKKYFDAPLQIQAWTQNGRYEYLKQQGWSADRSKEISKRDADAPAAGTYDYKFNRVFLDLENKTDRKPIPLEDLEKHTRHELGHALDDYVVKRDPKAEKEGSLTETEDRDVITSHWEQGVKLSGFTKGDLDSLAKRVDGPGKANAADNAVDYKDLWLYFPGSYSVTGGAGAKGVDSKDAIQEYFAETAAYHTATSPERRADSLIATRDPVMASALNSLFDYRAQPLSTEEMKLPVDKQREIKLERAKNQFREILKQPWPKSEFAK